MEREALNLAGNDMVPLILIGLGLAVSVALVVAGSLLLWARR